MLYELEVKRYLVEYLFPPTEGWEVTIDVDPMEKDSGGQHSADKKERASRATDWLKEAGVRFGAHPDFGRADLVAAHPRKRTVVLEVKGEATIQKGTAVQQAFGQLAQRMRADRDVRYGIAVPDARSWESQLRKFPPEVSDLLSVNLWLVDKTGVRSPGTPNRLMSRVALLIGTALRSIRWLLCRR